MAHGRGGEDSYSGAELRDVTVDFLLAGRDTKSVTLAWFIYEMCRYPEMVEKIYKEGIHVMGKHTDFESMADHLTHDNLSRMHYLHAALSESLRLHPPVPRAGPRICLGRDSAFLQLKVTLAPIIHFFTFQLVPGQELTYTSTLVMPMKNGIQVTVSPRTADSDLAKVDTA